tara:strand:+ start:98 stop:343 length:246 start_codon:yes stop_codon:yes gene_type:complete
VPSHCGGPIRSGACYARNAGWLSQILATSIADHGRKLAQQRQRKVIMAPTHLGGVNDATDEDCDVTEKLRARRNAPLHRTR